MYNASYEFVIPGAFGAGNTSPTLHLFVSDLTPNPEDDPYTLYHELSNSGYAPKVLNQHNLVGAVVDGYSCLAVNGQAWALGTPLAGNDTIFGWWIGGNESSIPAAGWGGRFDTPVVIPPAGMLLVLNQIAFPLHDCGTVPPPPPPPSGRLWNTDADDWNVSAYNWESA
jgi:hypothetical protein